MDGELWFGPGYSFQFKTVTIQAYIKFIIIQAQRLVWKETILLR